MPARNDPDNFDDNDEWVELSHTMCLRLSAYCSRSVPYLARTCPSGGSLDFAVTGRSDRSWYWLRQQLSKDGQTIKRSCWVPMEIQLV